MHILIANDDGIYSPGILALAQVAKGFGEVRIVAPDVEQSSMGHAVTANRPLTHLKTPIQDFDAWRVNGTPADCVSLGISIWGKVDLVLSGINLGLNIGNSCWHSGTLAAAKQAALLGVKSIAFSAPMDNEEPNFEALKPSVREVLERVVNSDFHLLNVNMPQAPQGLRWTRQSVRHYNGHITPGFDPRGRPHYWFHETPLEDTEEDTDRWAVQNGLTSIMPVRLDLTDHDELSRFKSSQS